MRATIVYQQIWDALNERADDGGRKYRYFVLEGSSRSSKTRSLLQVFYTYAYENEKCRLSVWRDVAKDCRDTVGHDMEQVYPDLERYNEVKYHTTKSIYTFPTKCTIEICGTDDVNKVHGYQGDVIWLNEPYKISKDTFDQLDMRTTDIVFIDWNPKQQHFIDDLKKDPRTIVLHNTFKDNPFCPPEQRKKILSYQSVSQCGIVLSKALKEPEAKMYDYVENPKGFTDTQIRELVRCKENELKRSANRFNWDIYGLGIKAERPNRILRFTKILDEQYHAIKVHPDAHITCIDWGAVDPWGILDMKYYDGALYLHQRNYKSENKLREELTDTELAQIEESEEGFITWYFSKFGIPKDRVIPCDSNRPLKILGLRAIGYDYAVAATKGSGSVIDGIDGLNSMPVYYTASSTDLEYEQENYSRKVDRYGIVLEEPEDLNNHLIDPARYGYQHFVNIGLIQGL